MTESTWGLALDAGHARIVRDLEARTEGQPLPDEVGLEVRPKRASEIMSDRPGRSHASTGAARSAMEYASDPVREAERAFCEEVLWLVGTHLRRGDFDRLVVAAPPRMMGLVRERRSAEIARATVAEATKDYAHLDPADLRRRLQELLPSRLG